MAGLCGKFAANLEAAVDLFAARLIEQPFTYIPWVVLVAFSICVHEFMHAYVAHRLGDDTAAEHGHLSLNPMVQMGPFSLIMLLLIGIAWGAVPVNPNRLRGRYAPAAVAFAGPLSNLALSAAFGLLCLVSEALAPGSGLRDLFALGSLVNGALFVLNLLPIPPLDGWQMASNFAPPLARLSPQVVSQLSWMLFLLILMTPAFSFVWMGGAFIASLFGA